MNIQLKIKNLVQELGEAFVSVEKMPVELTLKRILKSNIQRYFISEFDSVLKNRIQEELKSQDDNSSPIEIDASKGTPYVEPIPGCPDIYTENVHQHLFTSPEEVHKNTLDYYNFTLKSKRRLLKKVQQKGPRFCQKNDREAQIRKEIKSLEENVERVSFQNVE